MANSNPPKRAQAFTFRVFLADMAVNGRFKVTPTLAAGDFKIDKDGAGYNNLATLPTVSPAATASVLISLSATEMTADQVTLLFSDQTVPAEWGDWGICLETTA